MAHHLGHAAVRNDDGGEHAHERGLPGAVRPENREDHAARHIEVDPVDRPHRAEALDETAGKDSEVGRVVAGRNVFQLP